MLFLKCITSHLDGNTFFFCASFFPFFTLSAPPFPRQFSSPKSSLSGTSDLLFLVEKRQPPGAGFRGRFWTRSPHRKKRKIVFSGARKKDGSGRGRPTGKKGKSFFSGARKKDGSGRGRPTGKKGKSFFSGARKKVREFGGCPISYVPWDFSGKKKTARQFSTYHLTDKT